MNSDVIDTCTGELLLNVLLQTPSCVFSEIVFLSFYFPKKMIKGGWNKSGEGALENF